MAGEILAAFRTVMLFISFSWLSIMYLLVYRVPRLEKSNQVYRAIENGIRSDNKKYFKRLEESFDGNIQIFGEDLPQIRWDLSNPRKKLLGRNNQTLQEFSSSDIPVSIRKVKKNLTEIHSQNIDFSSGDLDCRLLDTMETFEVLGSGYTKVVRRGVLAGKAIALKYTSEGNHDIVQCKTERPPERHFECFNLAKFKLLKEALLFRQLKHRNIVKVCLYDSIGFSYRCVTSHRYGTFLCSVQFRVHFFVCKMHCKTLEKTTICLLKSCFYMAMTHKSFQKNLV